MNISEAKFTRNTIKWQGIIVSLCLCTTRQQPRASTALGWAGSRNQSWRQQSLPPSLSAPCCPHTEQHSNYQNVLLPERTRGCLALQRSYSWDKNEALSKAQNIRRTMSRDLLHSLCRTGLGISAGNLNPRVLRKISQL